MNAPMRRSLIVGALSIATVLGACFPGRPTAERSAPSVLVAPLLRTSALSDTIASLVRRELEEQHHVPVLPRRAATAPLQRTDSAGKPWNVDSVRELASSLDAAAYVDVSAVRDGDRVKVQVVKSTAPFTIVDSWIFSDSTPGLAAQQIARQLVRKNYLFVSGL